MASMDDHAKSDVAKMLLIGNNGSGKTGSLVSLAEAGFNLRILDFDNGAEILKQLVKPGTDAYKRIDIETHVDEYKTIGGKPIPKLPLKGLAGGLACLDNWPGGLGKPYEWGADTVLVMDSLTMSGKFALNHVLALNNRLGQPPQIQDWGAAMDLQENICAMLFGFKCHVAVLAHVVYRQPEGEPQNVGYPSALGDKLPPKIGSYFNHTLYYGNKGFGNNKVKRIFTKAPSIVETKTPAPGQVKDDYPLDTGLADYFRDLGYLKS